MTPPATDKKLRQLTGAFRRMAYVTADLAARLNAEGRTTDAGLLRGSFASLETALADVVNLDAWKPEAASPSAEKPTNA